MNGIIIGAPVMFVSILLTPSSLLGVPIFPSYPIYQIWAICEVSTYLHPGCIYLTYVIVSYPIPVGTADVIDIHNLFIFPSTSSIFWAQIQDARPFSRDFEIHRQSYSCNRRYSTQIIVSWDTEEAKLWEKLLRSVEVYNIRKWQWDVARYLLRVFKH